MNTPTHKLRWSLLGAGAAVLILAVSSATAANPGDPFQLGVANTINSSTRLSGETAAPQLTVINADFDAPAIRAEAVGAPQVGDNAFGIYAMLSASSPASQTAAVRGENKATNQRGYGLWGSQAGSGAGVYGTSVLGAGVYGKLITTTNGGGGVFGESASPNGLGVVGKNSAGGAGVAAFVNPGAPPLKVNSATKVDLLNADLLDGLDSTTFLDHNDKAADSDKLDGIDSTAFLSTSGEAADSDKLDGIDSTGFLPTSGKAADADKLDGLDSTALSYWKLRGNSSTSPGKQFIGTSDNKALELRVNLQRALRIEPGSTPNLIGGSGANSVDLGMVGATIGGGGAGLEAKNRVTGGMGTVGGGWRNTAGGSATVAGGEGNTASGNYSTVAGGFYNIASGSASFAAGSYADSNQDGSFVWGDSTPADLPSPGVNTFAVRASGGIWLGTDSKPFHNDGNFIDTSTGGSLTSGGVWTDNSDRARKHDFRALDKRLVLDKVARMPITSWSYKAEQPSIRHIGPMAQDFYKAFGLGLDDKHITTIDEGGVALAAIQSLYRQNQALRRENARLGRENRAQDARLAKLETALGRLSRAR